MKYTTKLVWTNNKKILLPFYKYNMNIGFIPADINFTYKGKQFNTVIIMNAISSMCKKNAKFDWNYHINDWYDATGTRFNKRLFIKLQNACSKTIKDMRD
jgi:hypothetical protein